MSSYDSWKTTDRTDELNEYGERARGAECQECGRIVPGRPGTGTICARCIDRLSRRVPRPVPTAGREEIPAGRGAEAVPAAAVPQASDGPREEPQRPGVGLKLEVKLELDRDREPDVPWPDDDGCDPRASADGLDVDRGLRGLVGAEADPTDAAAAADDCIPCGVEVDVEAFADGAEGERPADIDVLVEQEGPRAFEPFSAQRMPRAGVHAEVAQGLVDDGDPDVVELGERPRGKQGGAGVEGVGRVVADVRHAEASLATAREGRVLRPDTHHGEEPAAPTRHESRLACPVNPLQEEDRMPASAPIYTPDQDPHVFALERRLEALERRRHATALERDALARCVSDFIVATRDARKHFYDGPSQAALHHMSALATGLLASTSPEEPKETQHG